ncbi:unnamed protein product [Rangifer tarandus platyrhynchus]|uniref:Uncharacterized protein n=1 Tax=Rangifer tarandus platyrhynchus TaxID=3082113 RepID=A0AC59Z0T2_RANTA
MPDVGFRAPRPPFQKTSILDERVAGCVAQPPAEHSGWGKGVPGRRTKPPVLLALLAGTQPEDVEQR